MTVLYELIYNKSAHQADTPTAPHTIRDPTKIYHNRTSQKRMKSVAEGRRKYKGQRTQLHLSDDDTSTNSRYEHTLSQPSAQAKGRPRNAPSTCTLCGKTGHSRGIKCEKIGPSIIAEKERKKMEEKEMRDAEKKKKERAAAAEKEKKAADRKAAREAKRAEKKAAGDEKKAVAKEMKAAEKARKATAQSANKENKPPS